MWRGDKKLNYRSSTNVIRPVVVVDAVYNVAIWLYAVVIDYVVPKGITLLKPHICQIFNPICLHVNTICRKVW
jgi:hypothetical protein